MNKSILTMTQEKIRKLLGQQKLIEPILNSFSINMVLFDAKHNYIYANPMAIRDSKVREWIIGKNDFDYCKLKGLDVSMAKKRRKYYKKSVKTKSDVEWVDKHITRDGKTQYILRKFHPVFKNGDLLYVMGYGMDVSELKSVESKAKKTKKKYERIIQNMSDGLLVDNSDSSGTVLYCNERFREIFGFSKGDVKQLKIEDYIAPEYQQELKERHNKRIKGEEVSRNFECEGIRKDGKRIWIQVRVAPIIENKKVTGTQALVTDISEKKEKEIELFKLNQELINTEEAERTRIAYELHDSVNQKLAAIRMFLLASKSENTAQIDQLLNSTISEIRAISNSLAPKELANKGLISAIEGLINQLPKEQIKINFNCSKEIKGVSLEKHIEFNLYRIIQENLTNIIKHSRASEVSINFELESTSMIIKVTNNGRKIENSVLKERACFIAIKRRVNILNGHFTLAGNKNKNVVFEYRIPLTSQLSAVAS